MLETPIRPTWDDLRVLLALHRHRSFLAAGKALGVSTSTAARRIEALESSLGRPLVHRSSAGTSVEPDALELVSLAEQLELGLQAVRRDEGDETVSGTVRLTMGDGFVRPVTKILSELRRAHSGLLLEVISEHRMADLARREADIGIRKTRSASPVLIEKSVGRLPFALYASQGYVERRIRDGRLKKSDFARHDFVGPDGELEKTPQAKWLVGQGAKRFVVRSNSDIAQQEAAEQGAGIVMMAMAQVQDVAGLQKLEVEDEVPSVPIYLVFHKELRSVPRVKLVVRALETAMRAVTV